MVMGTTLVELFVGATLGGVDESCLLVIHLVVWTKQWVTR